MPGDLIIYFDNVSLYQDRTLILANISLTISRGEFVYLIGRTGTGKSTLMKALYAELPVRSGTAGVAGYDLKKIRRQDIPHLRRKIAQRHPQPEPGQPGQLGPGMP